jgi:non-specific serine/threonine protein kinase/serine/threonine-protein kinase
MDVLAITRGNQGYFADEERLSRDALDLERRVLGPDHRTTLATMGRLAGALTSEGQYAEAEAVEHQMLDIERRVFGPENMHTVSSMSIFADTLRRDGKISEAEALESHALDIERHILGPDDPRILYDLEIEAIYLSLEGRYRYAEQLFREAVKTAGKSRESSERANAWYAYACGAAIARHHKKAIEYLGHAVDSGFSASAWMSFDSDLRSLHGDPQFDILVSRAGQNASAQQP